MHKTRLSMLKSSCLMLGAAIALTACSSWMGDKEEEPPLEGERLSIVQFEKNLGADPSLAEQAITLPNPWKNTLWPQFGGYPSHVMDHLELGQHLKRAWKSDIGAGEDSLEFPLLASPVVADGRVFVLNATGHVIALSAENGTTLWKVRIKPKKEDEDVIGGGISYAEGKIFATAGFNSIIAIDPENGGMFWKYDTTSPLKKAPTILDGRVFVTSTTNETFALNANSGKLVWKHTGLNEGRGIVGGASPAAEKNLVVLPHSSGELIGLRAESGLDVWATALVPRFRQASNLTSLVDIQANPVIDGNLVIAANFSNQMVAVDAQTGALQWQQPIGSINQPWVAGDTVFVMGSDYQLFALEKQTGKIRWAASMPRYIDPEDKVGLIVWKGPLLAGGRLIMASSQEKIIELDPQNGAILKSWDTEGPVKTMPVIADKTLYLLTQNGYLTAYRGE